MLSDSHPFLNLDEYLALPRLGELALSPDGTRLVVNVSALDAERTAWTSALWEVDPAGAHPPHRLTRSAKGETLSAFAPDGSVLFASKRDVPAEGPEKPTESTSAVWLLPARGGEAGVAISRDGGYHFVLTAPDSDVVVLGTPMFDGVATDEADAEKRKARKDKKVDAILHMSSAVRYWDHDLTAEHTRLRIGRIVDGRIQEVRDLAGEGGPTITTAVLSPDGRTVAIPWRVQDAFGEFRNELVVVATGSGERRSLAGEQGLTYHSPVFTRDGSALAVVEADDPSQTTALKHRLKLFDVASGEARVLAPGWDRWPHPACFSPDGGTLFVTADEDGHSPVFAVDVAGEVRRLTDSGAFSSVTISPDGATLFAVRTAYDCPGEIVAIDVQSGEVRALHSPVEYPELPGRLERVETTAADGTRIPGWLVLPEEASAEAPAPLTLWVHGGPMSSWNAWSWRWCPWLLAARGQAVLLPDPALSTGYGWDYLQRGWGRWGREPFTDVLALTDAVEARADVRSDQSAMMGGSFGGYMANWIATQTDRFVAIVTHASLWNLDAFRATTDTASAWRKMFTPEMVSEQSPHRYAGQITTPMLVIHGDKDYRVPISEGLALWWALTGAHDGSPETLPHRFLYFPTENHWILSPQHAKIWYETVLDFVDAHRTGRNPAPGELL